jgi:orotidine-5'-phosphate decarboxylase
MSNAKDKLIFALDVATLGEAMVYAGLLKDQVGMFKVGLELFVNAGSGGLSAIRQTAPNCGIFLDLKFHDIPATVLRAFKSASGLGVDLLTMHVGGGRASMEAVGKVVGTGTIALGVTVLTSLSIEDLGEVGIDTGKFSEPEALVLERARLAQDSGLKGVVSSPKEVKAIKEALGKDFIVVTPGIRLADAEGDDDQKRIATPYSAILDGADYIVVGRPIRDAPDPAGAAKEIVDEIERALQDR